MLFGHKNNFVGAIIFCGPLGRSPIIFGWRDHRVSGARCQGTHAYGSPCQGSGKPQISISFAQRNLKMLEIRSLLMPNWEPSLNYGSVEHLQGTLKESSFRAPCKKHLQGHFQKDTFRAPRAKNAFKAP